MKKIMTLVFVSALGGALTLGAYKIFIEKEQKIVTQQPETNRDFIPASYKTSNANLVDLEATSFVEAAEKTVHAVVHVKNTTISSEPVTLQDLFMGRNQQREQVGTGSGVIISPDGYIITNNHVIDGAQSISITSNDNKIYDAQVIGTDPKTDIALLKIEADEDLVFATFGDSDDAKIGDWVLAVGNPFNLTSTVTAGIISAKSRDLSGRSLQSFIQTDAAVNPGNSGGALVNTSGELIGINTAITSQTGSYIGYSFAVPSNIARKVIEDIMEYGNVQNGILGVTGNSLNSAYAEKNGVDLTEGFYVDDVEKASGADRAGLKSGDIITKLDNVKVAKFSDLSGYINAKRPNDIVKVTIIRRGDERIIPVTLSKKSLTKVDFLNLELVNLTKNIKEKYKVNTGAYVFRTTNEELYKKLGIRNGYIITDINDEPIESIEDILKFKQKYKNQEKLENSIFKLGVINNFGQKERFIFK